MILIGERINASSASVKEAIEKKDTNFILKEAKLQAEAGCQFIDINCGLSRENEIDDMEWLIKTVGQHAEINFSIDSPDPRVIEKGLAQTKKKAVINSITAEKSRYSSLIPLAKEYKSSLIALTIDESGMPDTADDRVRIAEKLYNILKKEKIPDEDIYIDPLIRPVSSEPKQAKEILKAITRIKKLGNIKIVCGISNISYGLPQRSLVNSIFLSMALQAGMDAALVDPMDKKIMGAIRASEAILEKDRFCMNFIKAHRKKLI